MLQRAAESSNEESGHETRPRSDGCGTPGSGLFGHSSLREEALLLFLDTTRCLHSLPTRLVLVAATAQHQNFQIPARQGKSSWKLSLLHRQGIRGAPRSDLCRSLSFIVGYLVGFRV